jgi:drug/metabolite transporter (DMT)-like permease
MWQSYALGSLLAGAFESTVDKAGIVRDGGVDTYVASFYRALFFLLAVTLVALTGLLGDLTFFFHWSYLGIAIIGTLGSIFFTYLLRTIEITVIGAATYLAPFVFLIIDTKLLGAPLSQLQMLGIVLLVCGGLAFSLDGKTHHFRRDLTWKVWAAILFIFVFGTAVEAYLYKYLHAAYDVNAVSYYVYSTVPVVVMLFAVVILKGRTAQLISPAAVSYMPYAALGKAFDSFNSVLYITALGMATLAQVSAFNALMPLMIVVVALFVQGLFGIRLKEHLDTKRVGWKLCAAVVLVVGGLLVG